MLAMLMVSADAASPKTRLMSPRSNGGDGNGVSQGYIDNLSNNGRYAAFESVATNLVVDDENELQDIFVHNIKTGKTRRVSITSDGDEVTDESSSAPALSGNGRRVAFISDSEDLVGGDNNEVTDIFVHNLETRKTKRVSVSSNGDEGDQPAGDQPDVSRNGRFVAFHTTSQLVGKDNNDDADIYVRDLRERRTHLVSIHSNGDAVTDGESIYPQISENGRFIVFNSSSSELINSDANGVVDVFIHDRQTGRTRRVSVNSNGNEVARDSQYPQVSADGRIISFDSTGGFVSADDNDVSDVYVHNRETGRTKLVTRGHNGGSTDQESSYTSLSPNGRMIGFYSYATNLIANDPDGDYSAYVYDRVTKKIRMVDRDSSGDPGDGLSYVIGMSGDGRMVLFASEAGHAQVDENDVNDVYRRGSLY
jgi:hypothetical protein